MSYHFGIFLRKFYERYPEYKNRELFLTGESYAGHYVPYIADLIRKEEFRNLGINLQGIALGNAWI